ncbi:DUF1963 domain-containing protein [Deinococcus radiomollis]|uniref:hypothetical protein n=1 Tax=Deinococcus radiomollis TaxID=468916 RepID=UPI003891F199
MAETDWPVSMATGKPLRFIGQVDLDTPPFELGRMAYLFVEIYDAELDKYFEDNWKVILQEKTGTGLMSPQGPMASETEWLIEGYATQEPDWSEMEAQGNELFKKTHKRDWGKYRDFVAKYDVPKIGGTPSTPGEIYGLKEPLSQWRLMLQLQEREENGKASDLPFYMDYGDGGIGWSLLSNDHQAVHFSWTSG